MAKENPKTIANTAPGPAGGPVWFTRTFGFEPARPDLAAALILAGTILVFFGPALAGGVYYFRDISAEIVPKRTWLAASGLQVLWNPYMFFGLPEGANSQTAAFYPLNLLFYFGSVPRALSYYITLHFAIALAFSYLLLRALRLSAPAGVIGAIAFAYGGFFLSLANQVVVLNSAAWIMPLLWAGARAQTTGRRGFIAAMGIFWGLMVLGGEAEIAYLSGLVLALFFAFLIFSGRGALELKPALGRAAVILGLALVLALGVSCVQWLITLELAGLSNRAAGLTFDEALKWSLEPQTLASLAAPNFIGDPAASRLWVLGFRSSQLPYLLSVYPGLTAGVALAAALALVLWTKSRLRPRAWIGPAILAAGAILFTVLSLGRPGGLYFIAFKLLPGFDRFRIPERCLFGFAVCFAILLALAVDAIQERLPGIAPANSQPDPTGRSRQWRWLLLAVAAGFSIALARTMFFSLPEPADPGSYLSYHRALLWLAFTRAGLAAVVMLAAALAAWLWFRKPAAVAAVIAAFLFLDLFLAHRWVAPVTEPSFYDLSGHLAEGLPRGGQGLRVMVAQPADQADRMIGASREFVPFYHKARLSLQAFTGLELRIREVAARSSFYPADVDQWIAWMQQASQRPGDLAVKLQPLAIGGVNYALRSGFEPIKTPDPMPRAYVVPAARWLPDRQAVLAALSAPGFDPRREVLLEGEPTSTTLPRLDTVSWPMTITRDENQRVEIQLEPRHPGYLVLLDSFYPGWEARVNGAPAKIYRANGFHRAIEVGLVPATVEFVYWPRRFQAGLAVSLATLALAGLLLVPTGRRPGPEPGQKPQPPKPRVPDPARSQAPLMVVWAGLAVVLVLLPMWEGGTTYIPAALLEILTLAIAVAWSFTLDPDQGLVQRTPLDIPIAAFWTIVMIQLVRTQYFYISFYWTLHIFALIVLFYITVQFTGGPADTGRRRAEAILGLMLAAAVAQSLWAVSEMARNVWLMGLVSHLQAYRSAAGYVNPANLAGSLMIISPYVAAKALAATRDAATRDARGRPGRRAAAWAGLFLVLLAGMVSTQSRAVVILPLALVVVGWPGLIEILEVRGIPRRRAARLSLAALAGVMVAAGLAVILVPNPLGERLRNLDKDVYAFERVKIWQCAAEVARDHPEGVGLGMFKYYANKHRFPIEGVPAGRYEKVAETAHNEYLHLAAELSPAGPLLALAALGVLVWFAVRVERGPGASPAGRGALGGLMVIALHAGADANLHNNSLGALLAVMAGLLVTATARAGEPTVIAVKTTRAGVWTVRLIVAALAAVVIPGSAYLAWSFGRTLRGLEEPDPVKAASLLLESAGDALGNSSHFKGLGLDYYKVYRQSQNVQDLERAIKAIERGLALNPADPDLHRLRGQYYLSLNQVAKQPLFLERADQSFQAAYERSPYDIDTVIGSAWVARTRGDREQEWKWWATALELEPYDLMSRLYLVRSSLELGRDAEAKAQWLELVRRRREVKEISTKKSTAFITAYRSRRVAIDDGDVSGVVDLLKRRFGDQDAAGLDK